MALKQPDGERRPLSYEGDLWRDLPFYQLTSHGTFYAPSAEVEALTARAIDIEEGTLSSLGRVKGIREHYMRQNALLARLGHLPDAPDDAELFALLALRWGLEDESSAESLSLDVPGAVM